jgi:hypothetical protein
MSHGRPDDDLSRLCWLDPPCSYEPARLRQSDRADALRAAAAAVALLPHPQARFSERKGTPLFDARLPRAFRA